MKTIVVGVDGSETAKEACAEAAALAEAMKCRLHLVTAVTQAAPVTAGIGSDVATFSTTTDAEVVLGEIKRSLSSELDVTTAAIMGRPADVIVEEAERVDADLIVVGNVRMQGVKRVLGSVANDVSHHASCSVYIAKTT